MINRKTFFALLNLVFFSPVISTELIRGDKDAVPGTTFSFPIKQNLMSSFGTFYVGAHESLAENKEFALSRLVRGTTAFEPIAPEVVVLNG